jgi:hypothetical protein
MFVVARDWEKISKPGGLLSFDEGVTFFLVMGFRIVDPS